MNAAVRKMPYDAAKAFDWIAMLGKVKPGYINLASAGGFQHFTSLLFHSVSGVDLQILLYRDGSSALLDVVSGQARMLIGSWVTSHAIIRIDKVKVLATGGANRTALLAELPTIAEAGLPN